MIGLFKLFFIYGMRYIVLYLIVVLLYKIILSIFSVLYVNSCLSLSPTLALFFKCLSNLLPTIFFSIQWLVL